MAGGGEADVGADLGFLEGEAAARPLDIAEAVHAEGGLVRGGRRRRMVAGSPSWIWTVAMGSVWVSRLVT